MPAFGLNPFDSSQIPAAIESFRVMVDSLAVKPRPIAGLNYEFQRTIPGGPRRITDSVSIQGRGDITMLRKATPERLSTFSDGVFAVLITVLVLDLRPPEVPTFNALLLRWPTWLSYAVSYLFIAIVWTNHHYLMRYAADATPRLLWFNFAHLFSVSLLPLSTAWMAASKLAPQPVAFYAAVFFLVNATYIALIWELIDQTPVDEVSRSVRRIMRFRSITTLCLFGLAAVIALRYPLVGLGICICCPIVYLKPNPWRVGRRKSQP
jgi:uncharacterized membrane protein